MGSPVVEKPSPVIEDLKFTEEEEEIVPDFQRIHISGEDQSGVCKLCVAASRSWLLCIRRFGFTFTDPYSNSSPDSDPIPLLGSWDWNLNLTMCSVKSSTYYNVAVWFAVPIGIRIVIRIRQCKKAIMGKNTKRTTQEFLLFSDN